MGFAQHIDYPKGISTLGSGYTSGSSSVTVATGDGVKFGTPTALNPVRFTMSSAATPTNTCHYSCTGRSTDTLTGVTVLTGTDQNFIVGDNVFSSVYAEDLNDIQTAIPTLPITVANGGTGLATLTAHAVLLGEGTSNVAFATIGTAGRLLIDQGASADPAFTAMSGDASITSGGAITVASIGGKAVTLGGSLTFSGAFATTITVTAGTSVTLPTSGTLVNTAVTTLSSLSSVGTITTGTWNGTAIDIAHGGTGQATASAAFNALSPLTTLGDIIYASGTNTAARLAGNTTSTKQFLTQTGTGSVSAAPGWGTVTATDVGLGNVTNDAQTKAAIVPNTAPSAGQVLVGNAGGTAYAAQTVSGSGATITLSSAGVVTISAIANASLSNNSVTVNTTAPLAGGGSVALGSSLTLSASVFVASGASHAAGIVPDPGASAGTTRFLCENATWAVPSGGGGSGTVNSGTAGQIAYYATTGTAVSGQSNLTVGSAGQLNLASQAAPGTPASGDVWFDSTQKCQTTYGGMTGYHARVIYIQNANVTVTAAAQNSFISTTNALGSVSLPAGYLNVQNRTLRISMKGFASTAASSPGNVTFYMKLGTNVIATSSASGQATSRSNQGFAIEAMTTVKTTGSSGTIDTGGEFRGGVAGSSGILNNNTLPLQNGTTVGTAAPTTPVTIDLTAAYTIDFGILFTAATNSYTITNILIEVLA